MEGRVCGAIRASCTESTGLVKCSLHRQGMPSSFQGFDQAEPLLRCATPCSMGCVLQGYGDPFGGAAPGQAEAACQVMSHALGHCQGPSDDDYDATCLTSTAT